MNNKTSTKSAGGQFQNQKPMMRRRKRIRTPAGHPTDAELIAAFKGPITKCPDGRAMGSLKSSDFGLAV
jgi:hypothetical protein